MAYGGALGELIFYRYLRKPFRPPHPCCVRVLFVYRENSRWVSGRWSRNLCGPAAPPAFNAVMICNDLRPRVLATKNAFLVTQFMLTLSNPIMITWSAE